jgi:hypothetical protein
MSDYLWLGTYLRIIGVYFAELDDIRAKIAGALARLHVEDETLQEEAERARTQARESAEASEAARSARESIFAPFNPSAELKTRFRDLAKRIHPDYGRDEADRLRRHQLMAEANAAYRSEDVSRLQAILREWEERLNSVSNDAVPQLQQMIQKISQVQDRLRIIKITIKKITIKQLRNSDISQLKERAEEDEKDEAVASPEPITPDL